MKTVSLFVIAAIVLLAFCGCGDTMLPVEGNKRVATYTHEQLVYFLWVLNIGSIQAWNLVNEDVWVRMEQKREDEWSPVFDVTLAPKDRDGRHIQANVIVEAGDKFHIWLKPRSQQYEESVWLVLEEDETGDLHTAVCPPDTT